MVEGSNPSPVICDSKRQIAAVQDGMRADCLYAIDDGRKKDDLLGLIIEVTGERDKDKEGKTAAA